MITIKEMLAVKESVCRPGYLRTGFIGVTIHNTGNTSNGANATAHGNYLRGTGAKVKASWHYAVDEDMAVQSLPEEERGYHAGDGTGNGNYKTIGIEICMNSDGDILKATDNAAELAADILYRNGVTVAKNYLYQHNNWSGKNCPQRIRAGIPYSWNTFIEKVQDHIDQKEVDMTKTEVIALIDERIDTKLKGSDTVVNTFIATELKDAIAAGITDGTRPGGYARRDEAAVIALRASKK